MWVKGFFALWICFFCSVVFAQDNFFPNQTTLPLKFNTGNKIHGLPSTVVEIQGKMIPLLLDTGASKSEILLTNHALEGINIHFTGEEHCTQITSKKTCFRELLIPELKIGNFFLHDVKGQLVKFWNSEAKKNFVGTQASQNGLIGLGFLAKFNVLLDYPHEHVTLVAAKHSLIGFSTEHWINIPFQIQGGIVTSVILNNKPATLIWDTGAIPSKIKSSVNFGEIAPCTADKTYRQTHCSLLWSSLSFVGDNQIYLPKTWFLIDDTLPSDIPFDGFIGSNFYEENLVYFDFDNHKIYIGDA